MKNLQALITECIPDAKQKRIGQWNFRCIVCGDSEKNKNKKRGYILSKTNRIEDAVYYCHNCLISKPFKTVIEEQFPSIYRREFTGLVNVVENLTFKPTTIRFVDDPPKEITDITSEMESCTCRLDKIPSGIHSQRVVQMCKKLISDRNLPKYDYRAGISGNMNSRLVIPYFDKNGNVYQYQGRALLKGQEPKYLTGSGNCRIFKLEIVDPNKCVMITEGSLDAMFLDNGIACTGGIAVRGKDINIIMDRFPNRIWVIDNDEPGLRSGIDLALSGESVFIPKFSDCKDVNDMVLKRGLTGNSLKSIIENNTTSGVLAITRLNLLLGERYGKTYKGKRR